MITSKLQLRTASSALLLALTALPAVHAADILWNGATTGTLDWNTGSNWTGGAFVNSTADRADLRLDWGATPTINLSAAVSANGILFDDTGATGDSSLTIGNGGVAANTLTLGGTNAGIEVSSGNLLTISAVIAGTNNVRKNGAGTLVLTGANTYNGGSTINAGTLQIGNGGTAGSLAGGVITVASGATLAYNRSDNVTVGNRITGAGGFTQSGAGTTTLSSTTSDFSGPVNITNGTLQVAAVGNGTITISDNARQLVLNSSRTYENAIIFSGATGSGSVGVIDTNTNINATLSGPITINGIAENGGHFGSSSGGSLSVSGAITASVPVTVRRGTVIFSGGGSYTDLQARAGTVRLGAANGIATNASVAIGGFGTAILDLNGFNQSLIGITKGANSATITNGGAAASVLTITGTSTFAGILQDGVSPLGLTIASEGNLTLSGVNTFTGGTTLNGGTLALGASDLLADSGALTLNGGTFATNGFSETLGALNLQADSFLDFGASNSVVVFSSVSASSGVLSLLNWTQGADVLRFTSAIAPSADLFRVNGGAAQVTGTANDWVVTAIPEPSAFAALAGAGALLCVATRRRRR